MSDPIIRTEWASYRAKVIPSNAPAIQLSECRQAFYAGAAALFYKIMEEADPGDEVTDDDITMMETIENELDEFLAEVAARAQTKGRV